MTQQDQSDLAVLQPARDEQHTRLLAFYLPQFHPTPENDEWWGAGFTEWSNVVRAKPLFPGHRPRRLPAELGFYDLRLPEVRQAQSDLALSHGVDGFIYWHYWFEGRRMLERPFEEVLKSGEPEIPFALGWANESWTGVWAGKPRSTLVEQTYSISDHERHANYLATAFHDSRYIKVDGRPLLYIYRPLNIPEPERALELWRKVATQCGFPDLYVIGECAKPSDEAATLRFCDRTAPLYWREIFGRAEYLGKFGSPFPHITRLSSLEGKLPCGGSNVDRESPLVLAGWDNTPRRGRKGAVLVGDVKSSIENQMSIAYHRADAGESPFVLIKSWNEWAEGNILEPCASHGRDLLEVVAAVQSQNKRPKIHG